MQVPPPSMKVIRTRASGVLSGVCVGSNFQVAKAGEVVVLEDDVPETLLPQAVKSGHVCHVVV